MRAGLTFVCAMAAAGAAMAQDSAAPNYAGEYVMAGKGFGEADSAYAGTCSITPAKDAYAVSCFNQDTRHTYVGKGLGVGDAFSVFIGDVLKGDHREIFAGEYLVIYKRNEAGVLTGVWTHAESAAAGAETLTPKK